MPNKVKDMLAAGQVVYGVWLEWLEPDLVEFLGYLGFDYVMIDGEHTALDRVNATELIRACDVVDMVPIVRVRENRPSEILGYLEQGARGIYVPHVNTAAEARAIVDAVKYAPDGHRGAGSARGVRFGLTMSGPDYLRTANQETMVIALIEEARGIENLDEIIEVPGIDVFGIGDGDLSHTMGHPGDRGHADVRRVVDDAESRIARAGKVFDAVVTDVEGARDAVRKGSLMVSVALRNTVADALKSFLTDVKQSS